MEVVLERKGIGTVALQNVQKYFRNILIGILAFSLCCTISPIRSYEEKHSLSDRVSVISEDVALKEMNMIVNGSSQSLKELKKCISVENIGKTDPEVRSAVKATVTEDVLSEEDTDVVPIIPNVDKIVSEDTAVRKTENISSNITDVPTDKEPVEDIPVADTVINGFRINNSGCITGYEDLSVVKSGLLALPLDSACYAVGSHAFSGLGEFCIEMYIPANIIQIEEDIFEDLPNIFYIEVSQDNPSYYSDGGILYSSDGQVVYYPGGR